MNPHHIFISGGTGYLGRSMTAQLLARGHQVQVLARAGSERKVAQGAIAVPGDALDSESFAGNLAEADTVVHLTGTPHPAPWKEREFRAVDLTSLRASTRAAAAPAGGGFPSRPLHFIYVSVAHPAPMMKSYIRVRRECEEILAETHLTRTILRPWYVLGPGHNWPRMLKPVYAILESMDATREGARRLGLVTLEEMTAALGWAVENPPARADGEMRVLDVPGIRDAAKQWPRARP